MPTRKELPSHLREELETLEREQETLRTTVREGDVIPERLPGPGAVRGRFYRPLKKSVTIRLDADVLDYFERDGPGYQTRINQALRSLVFHDETA